MKTIKLAPILLLFLFFMQTTTGKTPGSPQISYNLTFPEAQAHYVDVEMNITDLHQEFVVLKMPVWTPGSYLVREFEKNIEEFSVSSEGKPLAAPKTRKNWWHVNTAGLSSIRVRYRVYCFEVSVRTSFINAAHAFLSPTGVFVYPDKMLHEPSTVHIIPYKGWVSASSSLEMVNGDQFTRTAPNYDILYDSPIEVGNQDIFGFDAAGVKYEVCMVGGGNYDKERLKVDLAKIVAQETAVYGENPNKHYLFIVQNYYRGGGGLEHLSSTTLGYSRDSYSTEAGYRNFLSLAAHEHFHLWNVKRLRPIVLGPFDYDNENYTTDLWIAEGFTAYYQNIILRHAGLTTPEVYLTAVSTEMSVIDNQPGAKVQPLAEASYDSWIKAYRPNENSVNTTISYYDKGAAVAMLLDLEIINDSKGKYSLDDVMKYMYDTYYKAAKRGYTDAEFKEGLEKFAGKKLDYIYDNYVYGLTPIDYNHYLAYAGYKITDQAAATNDPTLGVALTNVNGKKVVASVLRGSAGWIDGINVNDEIMAIDTIAVTDPATMLNGKKVGDKIAVHVLRDNLPLVLTVTLLRNDKVNYKVEEIGTPTEEELVVRRKWLKL
jgi:predicted metalloprotease with PDZ domain